MSRTVAIIGAGPLGRWLALSAARAGFRVLLEDVMPANLHHAQEYIRGQLGPDAAQGTASQAAQKHLCAEGPGFAPDVTAMGAMGALQAAEKGLFMTEVPEEHTSGAKALVDLMDFIPGMNPRPTARASFSAACLAPEGSSAGNPPVTYVSTIEDAVREADLAIDCVPDELESKLEILWLLDRMSPPRTVFATPTTRLSIADLAACTYRDGKCVAIAAEARDLAGNSGAEILLRTTPRTSPETIALLENFWRRLGFAPNFQQETVVPDL